MAINDVIEKEDQVPVLKEVIIGCLKERSPIDDETLSNYTVHEFHRRTGGIMYTPHEATAIRELVNEGKIAKDHRVNKYLLIK